MADTLGSAAHNVGLPIISKLLTPESASTTLGLMLAVWAMENSSVRESPVA